MREPNFRDDIAGLGILLRRWVWLIIASLFIWALIILGVKAAIAAPYMGDCKLVAPRTYTVSVDPSLDINVVTAALNTWNEPFVYEYGVPIFAVHYGDWWDADVLLTEHGDTISWVDNRCNGGYVQRGNNLAVVNIGPDFDMRWLTHELGHVLGFADYVYAGQTTAGYRGNGVCTPASAPISIMSYCWQQNPVVLLPDDYVLIRNYWR